MEWTITVTSEDFSTDAAVLEDRRDDLVSRLQPLGLQDLLGFAADGAVGVVFSVPTTSPHESFAACPFIRSVEGLLLDMGLRLGAFSGTLSSRSSRRGGVRGTNFPLARWLRPP
jgi:hypothetical protein